VAQPLAAETGFVVRKEPPTGTVTFLFTDIEGSTQLTQELGKEWPPLLERHRQIARASWTGNGGVEIGTEGDSFFVAFQSAPAAVAAAVQVQRDLASEEWPGNVEITVRIGLHTGEAQLSAGSYVGIDVHRAARIAAAGHGGQVLLSATTFALLDGSGAWPPEVHARDLGEHALKDLLRPERIHQLTIAGLRSDFPPIRTLNAVRNNLPSQLTSFLGRDRELEEACHLLAQTRLLTLLGPGGTGKTRLALQTAAAAADSYPDGVYFVPLAMVTDSTLALPTLAQVLGLLQSESHLVDRLAAYLAAKRVLLVLDNFEQIIDAAPSVADLLGHVPQLSVLVTSRSPLRVYGEREYQVPPLGVPDPRQIPDLQQLAAYDSVALFVERAQGVRADFRLSVDNAEAVREICARLDGLPLAIELAAARVRVLSPQAIARRLDRRLALLSGGGARNLPERQQTLHAAIAWSHDLLDEGDKRFFARFAVFVGGADLSAVEEVVCEPGQADSALDDIESLLDKSLIRLDTSPSGEPRYGMLETIREFAFEQLSDRGEAALMCERQASWVANFVEGEARSVMGADRREALDRYESEHDNIRSALTWALATGHVPLAMRIFTGSWRFWQSRSFVAEARRHAERVMALPVSPAEREYRASAVEAAAGIAYWQGDVDAALRWYSDALDLARESGDPSTIANALYNVSFPLAQDPDGLEAAKSAAAEALTLYSELGDDEGVGRVLWGLSSAYYAHNEFEEGLVVAQQALDFFGGGDDLFMRAWVHYMLGLLLTPDPDGTEARRHLLAAHRLFVQTNDMSGHTLVFDALATLAWRDGDVERAMRLAGYVGNIERVSGTGLTKINREQAGFSPDVLAADPALAAAFEEGRQLTLEQATALALPSEQESSVTGP
jgi:predicted ATPase/class 3 adenylate cyclase